MHLRLVTFFALAFSLAAASFSDADVGTLRDVDGATSAAAESAPNYAKLGPYVAAGGGAAVGDMGPGSAGFPGDAPGLYDVLETGSLNLRAGWRFHRHVSVELLWEYQTAWEFEMGSRFGTTSEEAEFHAWNLLANLKVNLTTTRWQPFLVTGLGLGRRSLDAEGFRFNPESGTTSPLANDDEAFVARLGGGLDVYVNDSVTIGTELAWIIGTGELSALDYGVATVVLAWHLPY